MAERLTDKDSIDNKRYMLNSEDNQITLTYAKLNNGFRKAYCWGKPIDKLAMLEDIMDKYGIESVEELEKEMHSLMLIISILNDYGIEDYNELDEILKEFSYMKKMETEIGKELKFYKTDRDTWERACELACEYMCKFVIPCPDIHRKECKSFCDLNKADCYQDYFYQQAKKEGENNDTNN